MNEKSTQIRHRPLIVILFSAALCIEALVALCMALAGIVLLISGFGQAEYGVGAVCLSLGLVFGGAIGTLAIMGMAREIYFLRSMGYALMQSLKWNPLFWLLSGFGKKLSDPKLRAAFGIT